MGNEFLITLVVAWCYLTLVRFVDVNEREPIWSLSVVFVLGALGACFANLVFGSARLSIPIWEGALAVEATKLLALAAGILVMKGVARIRGWSEFSDLTDGLVYGIVVGLGYSVGETFVREVRTAQFVSMHLTETPWRMWVRAAASGLSHGVFGAIVGLGCGVVLEAESRLARKVAPFIGLAGAVALNALFRILAHGNALGGRSGLYRSWLAVLLPLALMIAIGLYALTVERRAIRKHLSEPPDPELIPASDLEFLGSFWRRQTRYAGLLVRGRVAECLRLAARHNRQVQLALLLRRIAREADPARRHRFERQAELVRAALRHAGTVAALLVVALGMSCGGPEPTPSPNPPEPAPAPSPGPVETVSLDSLLAPAERDIDRYWSGQLGTVYRGPESVGPYSALSTACPPEPKNARWCSTERKIYYDADWLQSFRNEAGDFVPIFVIAHEWGHLVQDVRGDLSPQVGLWSLQVELQADCLAGQWTHDASSRGVVTQGADDQAMRALRGMRDPVDYPWFKRDAHGDAGQRIGAFLEGDEGRTCAGADFWKRVHVDPLAAEQNVTPENGSILNNLACRVGRFERTGAFPWPEALSDQVTDAVQATFESADGVTVSYWAVALVSQAAAEARIEGFLENAAKGGYKISKEGPINDSTGKQIGQWDLLEGSNEIVVLRNGQKVTTYEGPVDVAWEFGTAKAEFDCK